MAREPNHEHSRSQRRPGVPGQTSRRRRDQKGSARAQETMGGDLNLDSTVSPAAPPIPEHELIRPIGKGSGGTVWLARNAMGTFRAVKIIRAESTRRGLTFQSELNGVYKFEPVSRLHDGLVDILQV